MKRGPSLLAEISLTGALFLTEGPQYTSVWGRMQHFFLEGAERHISCAECDLLLSIKHADIKATAA